MKSFCYSVLMYVLCFAYVPGSAQTNDDKEATLFELANALNLTEQFMDAEVCYKRLASNNSDWPALANNRGVNYCMWALGLLTEEEARDLIKYVFPFEMAANSGPTIKGVPQFDTREEWIEHLFQAGIEQFKQVHQVEPDDPGASLNLACAFAFQSRWKHDKALLRTAFQYVDQAEKKAPEGSTTKGHCLVVKGIIYDYLSNEGKRDEYFDLARQQHEVYPDPNLISMIQRNEAVAAGETVSFASNSGEKFDDFSLDSERIDGVSLDGWEYQDEADPFLDLSEIMLGHKSYPSSDLYIFNESNRYRFFHRTSQNYPKKSLQEIALGDSEASVRQAYGSPLRVRAASGGKYLYYEQNRIIFFIKNNGTVGEWMVFWKKD